MSARPSPTQMFLADALSTDPSNEEAPYTHPAHPENGEYTNWQPSSGRRTWLTLLGFLNRGWHRYSCWICLEAIRQCIRLAQRDIA
jgi:hypothetical protein